MKKIMAFALIFAMMISCCGICGVQAEGLELVTVADSAVAEKVTITRNRTNGTFTISGVTGIDETQEYSLSESGIKLEGLSGAKEIVVTDNAEASDEAVTPVYIALDGIALAHSSGTTTPVAVRGYSAAVLDIVGDSTISSSKGTAGIEVNEGNSVKITSSTEKTLTVTGNESCGDDGGAGAAIGGSMGNNAGKIHITGNVKVDAKFGGSEWNYSSGAVIGGGGLVNADKKVGNGGTIIIDGNAVVSAVSKKTGAAIGGGFSIDSTNNTYAGGDGGSITIKGNAKVTANSCKQESNAAAIGGAASGGSGTIIIEGNAVIDASVTGLAESSYTKRAAVIGSGSRYSNSETINNMGNITIRENATVIAVQENTAKDAGAAAIGGGMGSTAGTIKIEGGIVYAVGGHNAPGIGPGRNNSTTTVTGAGTISISGGTVIAKSGYANWTNAPAAIGRSTDMEPTTEITGGNVYAVANTEGKTSHTIYPAPTNASGETVYLVTASVADSNGNLVEDVPVVAGDYVAYTGVTSTHAVISAYNEEMSGKAYMWLPAAETAFETGGDSETATVSSEEANTISLTNDGAKGLFRITRNDSTAKYKIYNGATAVDAMCVLVAYDVGDKLIGAQVENVQKTVKFTTREITSIYANAASVRAFLWEDGKLIPLCEDK